MTVRDLKERDLAQPDLAWPNSMSMQPAPVPALPRAATPV